MKRFLRRIASPLVILGAVVSTLCGRALAGPPAQKLPSALLVFPLIQADESGADTRIELVNLSGRGQDVECFYVFGGGDNTCNEIGFFLSLTPYQPLSWLTTEGLNDVLTRSAAPPFFGEGELKCAVIPPADEVDVEFHNTIQGRATVYSSTGRTVSYGAVGFQRLSPGDFTGVVSLDGRTYAQCPDKLHFDVLADKPTATPATISDLILVPCSQDLLLQVPATITVQFLIINEFEQQFSTSISVTCFERAALSAITDALLRANLGTETGHLIIRGVNGPLLGLVVDEVAFQGKTGIAGNEPSFQGGRSATVVFP